MASPDQTTYSTLVLYDKSRNELVQTAVAEGQLKANWVARVGSVDLEIVMAMAGMVEELIFAANRLPDGIMEILLRYFGITRELGTPPSTTITITATDTTGYTVPAGTEFRMDNGVDYIVFATADAAVIAPGANQTTVSATASAGSDVGRGNTSLWNGTTAGELLSVLSPVAFIQTAVTASAVSGGEDPETDQTWRDRGVQLFRSLNSSLVLPDQFTAKALTYPGVFRATTLDNWNGVTDMSAAGYVTVAVADSSGTALSSATMDEIEALLDAQSQSGLVVTVVAPTYNEIQVQTVAVAKPDYVASSVKAAVEDAIKTYLSPAVWPWKGTVYHNELVSLIDQVDGVDRVTSVVAGFEGDTVSTADLELDGSFPLTTPGASILATVSSA